MRRIKYFKVQELSPILAIIKSKVRGIMQKLKIL